MPELVREVLAGKLHDVERDQDAGEELAGGLAESLAAVLER